MQQPRSRPSKGRALAYAGAAALGTLALINRVRSQRALAHNPPRGQFIDVDGTCLHYIEAGFGPPVLLVHGNGVMAEDWIISGLFDELARTHRVIAVDRPGFGHSSRPRGTRFTPERQADLFADLMDLLGVDRFTAVGQSYGALVTAAVAVRHPQRLAGAALIGGYFYPTARADVLLVSGSAVPVWGDLVNHTLMPIVAEAMEERMNRKIFRPAEVPERWRREFSWGMALRPSRVRAGAADAVHMIPGAARLSEDYAQLKVPLAIIAGRGDRLVDPSAHSERLHREVPRSRLILLDGAGHMAHHSAMDQVAAEIRLL